MISKSGRIALHMAAATSTELARSTSKRTAVRLWRAWMHGALMTLASVGVLIATLYLLRRGL